MIGMKNTNGADATTTTTVVITIIVVGGGVLLLIVGADNDDVVAAYDDALTITTDAGARGGRDALDEAIRVVLELPQMRLLWRHVARPDGDEGAYCDGRAGAHIEALGDRRARIVEQEVARRGERRRRKRGGHAAGQQQDGSGSLSHLPAQAGSRPRSPALWGWLWGLPKFHPKEKPSENSYMNLDL